MRFFRTILTGVFLLCATAVFGQQCGTQEIHDSLMLDNISYRTSYLKSEASLYDNTDVKSKTQEEHIIPIVVHIIHMGQPIGTGDNHSRAQIDTAIKGINERFNGK